MRRRLPTALMAALAITICLAGTAVAKPPPKVLTADVCDNSGSGFQVFWIRYSYSGFRHIQAAGYDLDTPGGVAQGVFGLAPDDQAGSGVQAFGWGGVVVINQATAVRATLYANSLNKPVAVSSWIPITDNSIGGLSNNGWPPCQ
jgi:hypothetical protein